MLFRYLQRTRELLGDQRMATFNEGMLIDMVNEARREVAMRSNCVRLLPATSGAVTAGQIVNGGSGYTAPTLVISTPDSPTGAGGTPGGAQAFGTVTQLGGVIDNVYVEYGGDGYFQPTLTVADPTGKGAIITPVLSNILTANPTQEVYPFSAVPTWDTPGVDCIYAVRSVSLVYSGYRYSLLIYPFSIYQAKIRQYANGTYSFTPAFGAQFGRGAAGSFYLFPTPNQTWQMEWDCSCLPLDLENDQTHDAIPYPWSDAVPYFATHLAYMTAANHNLSRSMLDLFDQRMTRYGAYVDHGRTPNPYGRP